MLLRTTMTNHTLWALVAVVPRSVVLCAHKYGGISVQSLSAWPFVYSHKSRWVLLRNQSCAAIFQVNTTIPCYVLHRKSYLTETGED